MSVLFGLTSVQILERIKFWDDMHQCKPREGLMTREEARKLVFNACKNLEGRECGQLVEALEALGLIKFAEPVPTQDEVWMAKAKKYSESMVEYDYHNPVRTINEMATVISFLYRKLTGIGLREWMNNKGYDE